MSTEPEVRAWERAFGLPVGAVDAARAARAAGEGDLVDDTEAAAHARDLALALGCARGNARAIATFDEELGPVMDRAIDKSASLGLSRDEFRQIIREKLFVSAPGSAPRIAQYEGRAPLAGWLRVLCARAVIDLARRRDDTVPVPSDDLLFERLAAPGDPELASLRARTAHVLPAAFQAALRALAPRQRNLLRQRYLHGVAASTLATQYGVHRATVFGWIEDARAALMLELRSNVNALSASELDSVLSLMGSELDLSIRRLLDSRVEEEGP